MVSMILSIIVGVMDLVLIGDMVLVGVMASMIHSTTLGMIHGIQAITAITDILMVMPVGIIHGTMVGMVGVTHIMEAVMFLMLVAILVA